MSFRIAFQTLACPDWSWTRILDEANRLGYDGIELRGIQGEMYLPKAEPFQPDRLDATIADLARRNLHIVCLDTSCLFHVPERYEGAIREGKDTIDLAVKLGTPYIRVFGDKIPSEIGEGQTVASVAAGLTELGRYAESRGIKVLLELHGDFVTYPLIKAVLAETHSPAVGLLWDIVNPMEKGESPEVTFRELAPYIHHVHIKDYRIEPDGSFKLCLIGDGLVPIPAIVRLLKENGYPGWLSLEYEKKWHPELEEPEVSLPAFITYIKDIVRQEEGIR